MADIAAYESVRLEIIANHVLMHVVTVVVALVMLGMAGYLDGRVSVLSVLAPLFTLSWAAAMVRFDFFIHRQGAYLRSLEERASFSGWEQFHASSTWTPWIVPAMDVLGIVVIVVPTVYILFGPAQAYFDTHKFGGGLLYAWAMSAAIMLLLTFLAVVPRLAQAVRNP